MDASVLTQAMGQAAQAAASTAGTAGRNLLGDVQNFVLPELRGLADDLVEIQAAGLDEKVAKLLMQNAVHSATTRIAAVAAELTLLEIQRIINAALQAVADVVNKALPFALL